jgi:hypothetical protein
MEAVGGKSAAAPRGTGDLAREKNIQLTAKLAVPRQTVNGYAFQKPVHEKKERTQPMLQEYLGLRVVVDTDSSYIAIGELAQVDDDYIRLVNVDLRDTAQGSSKENYVVEQRRGDVNPNREVTLINQKRIIAISPFDKVYAFR